MPSYTHPTFEGIGPLGKLAGTTGASVFCQFENVISLVIGVLTVSAGLWFIFQFIGGALQWLGSGGDKQALQNAQKRIMHAVVGLVLVIITYTLIGLISAVFGLKIFAPYEALFGTPSSGCTVLQSFPDAPANGGGGNAPPALPQ